MGVRMTLSLILIVKNEAGNIRACLESVSWADEIIVLDSGSVDDTVALCREYTDKVFITDWPGFGVQKNRALNMAQGEWVLSVDADERVSPQLRAEIEAAISNPGEAVAFKMPRLSSYCGRYMHHSGWWPDYVIRLFRRGNAKFSDDLVHERVIVDGITGELKQPLIHDSFKNLEKVLQTIDAYSSAGALMMHRQGRETTLLTAILHGLWSFFHTYIVRAGFLDGREGFILAVSNAEGTYYKYLKLMYLEKADKPEK